MDNKHATYRQIRYDRTYRPLGKMSWWRVVLGTALLVFVFLLSGVVSQRFASQGHFKTAQALMVSPSWVEKYKPELKAYIDAGVLYENGDYEAARQAFGKLDSSDAVLRMRNLCSLKEISEKLATGEYEAAYDILTEMDVLQLTEAESEEFYNDCAVLLDYYSMEAKTDDSDQNQSVIRSLTAILDEKERST